MDLEAEHKALIEEAFRLYERNRLLRSQLREVYIFQRRDKDEWRQDRPIRTTEGRKWWR